MVTGLFFGCQLKTWFLFPTLRKGRECFAPQDASKEEEEEEEDEEEELDDLFILGGLSYVPSILGIHLMMIS